MRPALWTVLVILLSVLIVLASAIVVLARCVAASLRRHEEQFFGPEFQTPAPRAAYTLSREPLIVPTDFGPVTLPSGEVIVTAQGVRIPLSLFPNEAELDDWLATLEEIDRIGAEA